MSIDSLFVSLLQFVAIALLQFVARSFVSQFLYGKAILDFAQSLLPTTPIKYQKIRYLSLSLYVNTAQKLKFSIKDFFSNCDQIRNFLRIWSHLLTKSLMENFIFCTVKL